MGSKVSMEELTPGPDQHPTRQINGGTRKGAESADAPGVALLLREHPALAQPAQDHHRPGPRRRLRRRASCCMWACDLIVAADDATLRRRRRHPPRHVRRRVLRATRGSSGPARPRSSCSPATRIDADEAHRSAWSARSSRPTSSRDRTLEFARRIAELPTMTALLIKESVNQTRRQHGLLQRARTPASRSTSSTTPTGPRSTRTSTRWRWRRTASPTGRTAPPIVPLSKDQVRAES